nr:AbrB/MazE/SpoVT family DNA-binding domain-containing protein [Natronosalvus caseinilyticus]
MTGLRRVAPVVALVIRVSQKGQATIPKTRRERFGVDTPGEVFNYEEDERIIVEPILSPRSGVGFTLIPSASVVKCSIGFEN